MGLFYTYKSNILYIMTTRTRNRNGYAICIELFNIEEFINVTYFIR